MYLEESKRLLIRLFNRFKSKTPGEGDGETGSRLVLHQGQRITVSDLQSQQVLEKENADEYRSRHLFWL